MRVGNPAKRWHKSSYSSTIGSDCVEVSEGRVTEVRDTKARQAGSLTVPGTAWSAFLSRIA